MTSKNTNESKPTTVVPLLGRSERPHMSMMRRPRPVGRSPPAVSHPTGVITAGHINANNNNNIIDNSFTFQPTKLRRVPVFYPIAKTSKVVEEEDTNTLLLPQVASRIADCLRILSINTTYDNTNATASLTTIEGVRMQLCLWDVSSRKSENNRNEFGRESVTNGNNCRKILVELQRWSGDTMLFHRYSRDILKTAAGLKERATFNVVNDGEMKSSGYGSPPEEKKEEEYEKTILALESAHTLLMKDRIDAKQLGFESLLFITDPHKNGDRTTTKFLASQVILLGAIQTSGQEQKRGNEQDSASTTTAILEEIHKIILSLVCSTAEHEEEDRFRNLALSIFGNALDVFRSSCGDNNNNIQNMGYYQSLVRALVTELSCATQTGTSPHTTYLLMRCLRLLLCCSSSNSDNTDVNLLLENGGLCRAMDIGARAYQKLELECEQFREGLSLKFSN